MEKGKPISQKDRKFGNKYFGEKERKSEYGERRDGRDGSEWLETQKVR